MKHNVNISSADTKHLNFQLSMSFILLAMLPFLKGKSGALFYLVVNSSFAVVAFLKDALTIAVEQKFDVWCFGTYVYSLRKPEFREV